MFEHTLVRKENEVIHCLHLSVDGCGDSYKCRLIKGCALMALTYQDMIYLTNVIKRQMSLNLFLENSVDVNVVQKKFWNWSIKTSRIKVLKLEGFSHMGMSCTFKSFSEQRTVPCEDCPALGPHPQGSAMFLPVLLCQPKPSLSAELCLLRTTGGE